MKIKRSNKVAYRNAKIALRQANRLAKDNLPMSIIVRTNGAEMIKEILAVCSTPIAVEKLYNKWQETNFDMTNVEQRSFVLTV